MQIVEFVGAPGAGKTTLAYLLSKNSNELISYNDAYIKAFIKLLQQHSINSNVVCLYKTIHYIAPNSRIKRQSAYLVSRMIGLDNEMLFKFYQDYPTFIQDILSIVHYYQNDHNRQYMLKAFNGILLNIEKHMVIKQGGTKQTILVDEGLVKGVQTILAPPFYNKKALKKHIESYLENIPIPKMLVYLQASPGTCLLRMEKRKTGHPEGYREMSNEDRLLKMKLETTNIESSLETIKAMGIPVMTFSSETNIYEIVEKVRKEICNC